MWIIRFLNGPLGGQIFQLEQTVTVIGRASSCDIQIASAGISKEHVRIELLGDKVIVSDAGSRNGTFVNGVKIRSSKVSSGDKVGVHDWIFEILKVPHNWQMAGTRQNQNQGHTYGHGRAPSHGTHGNLAMQQDHEQHEYENPNQAHHQQAVSASQPSNWLQFAQAYVDRVILPGIYRLPEIFEFKWVLAGFMALFVILVTSLSTIPLVRILKVSIEEESQQHALTIATTLARVNRPYLIGGQESATSVDIATARPGVTKAFLISSLDGNIIAPAAQAGSYPDIPFVHEARKLGREAVKQVDDNTVVAMVPVAVFNAEAGSPTITHWAVVLYDMSSLAVDNGQVLSLFITTLFIALIIGLALFFVLYKLIEYPILDINRQLDQALKTSGDTLQTTLLFPPLQALASNVSSALSRAVHGSQDQQHGASRNLEHDRNREISNLVDLMGFAALGVRAQDLTIAAVNGPCESRLGLSAAQLTSMTINEINDQAFKLSVKDLVERVDQNPDEIATNDLDINGISFQIVAQGIFGSQKLAYYLIVILPKGEEA